MDLINEYFPLKSFNYSSTTWRYCCVVPMHEISPIAIYTYLLIKQRPLSEIRSFVRFLSLTQLVT